MGLYKYLRDVEEGTEVKTMEWNIREIENIKAPEAAALALEKMQVKGHDVFFVDFPGCFGYSALVFKDGRHIYYANDYELHHRGKSREELKDLYVRKLNAILFTEAELGTVKDYDDYKAKSYFLRNYYPMRTEYVSCFHTCHDKKEEAEYQKKIAGKHLNPISFCYMDDLDFIKRQAELMAGLEAAKDKLADSFDYWKSAYKEEMYNHEYGINWQADFDVLSVFGNLEYDHEDLEGYFDQLEMTDVQRRAYREAKREYYKETADWF